MSADALDWNRTPRDLYPHMNPHMDPATNGAIR